MASDIFNAFASTKKMDIRKLKTRIATEEALVTLLKDKKLEDITICELAQEAMINRKTFYNNFSSIESVCNAMQEDIVDYIISKLPPNITVTNETELYPLIDSITKSLEPYREIVYKVVINNATHIINPRFEELIRPYLNNSFANYNVEEKLIPYISSYLLSGLSSLYKRWLADPTLTTDQLTHLIYNMTISSIKHTNFLNIMEIQ